MEKKKPRLTSEAIDKVLKVWDELYPNHETPRDLEKIGVDLYARFCRNINDEEFYEISSKLKRRLTDFFTFDNIEEELSDIYAKRMIITEYHPPETIRGVNDSKRPAQGMYSMIAGDETFKGLYNGGEWLGLSNLKKGSALKTKAIYWPEIPKHIHSGNLTFEEWPVKDDSTS